MNLFVHGKLGHFFLNETDGEGNDLPGASTETEEEEEPSGEKEESSEEEEEDDDSVVVTIGDEKPPTEEEDMKNAPPWVKNVRKDIKEKTRRIRDLEQELAAAKASVEQKAKVTELGAKPTLEDSDWDADDFEQKLTAWHDRKRQVEQEKQKAVEQEEAQKQEWQGRLSSYAKGKTELKVKDFDDAEAAVMSMFDQTQQGIIIDVMDNPALMVYALGTNHKAAERLAAIKKPTKFLRELSRMEDKELKVQPKKNAPPPPEGKVRGGSAPVSGSVDSTLERLRADAEKSGDYSKVTQYRKQQKEKQKA